MAEILDKLGVAKKTLQEILTGRYATGTRD